MAKNVVRRFVVQMTSKGENPTTKAVENHLLEVNAELMRVTAGNALVFQAGGKDILAFNFTQWQQSAEVVDAPPKMPTREDIMRAVELAKSRGEFEQAAELEGALKHTEESPSDNHQ